MIRLPKISEENETKFYEDTYPRMRDMLLRVGGSAGFESVIRCLSVIFPFWKPSLMKSVLLGTM